jgi:GTP cyclohydrolase IA
VEEAVHFGRLTMARRAKQPKTGATAGATPTPGRTDPAYMAQAVYDFLVGAGFDPATDPELEETPGRVTQAWLEDFLDGYRADPKKILADLHPTTSRELVIATGIDFHSMCPHHLLPYRGLAHVAYIPKDGVVGFGKLVELVDAFSHRLVLQEQIAEDVAQALVTHLGARGAACVLDAEQGCLTMRGPKRREARTVTRAFAGSLARDKKAQASFLGLIGKAKKQA